jgi:hypothetical protein
MRLLWQSPGRKGSKQPPKHDRTGNFTGRHERRTDLQSHISEEAATYQVSKREAQHRQV